MHEHPIVPQDTVLFNDTVGYNIGYGRPEADQEEVERVAKLARIHDFITALPDGYDSELTERGQNLSQGQRQLLAFARVLAADPEILVLDEATAVQRLQEGAAGL